MLVFPLTTARAQLQSGISDAVDGVGLKDLGMFRDDWSRDRDLLFEGGASAINKEFDILVQNVVSSSSDEKASAVFHDYMKEKK